ncbi:MAG: N-acetylglucosamine/diacetylchitobiose ABC transporter substrate-binding protein [Bifidobacteriaceae bacterium]|jgi:N-acetylglucosamine transport system substrate-binding protein|nr:N-acetylglucosamine/diacetylchitobiose ABC transporter substrate-binding protein [Bifidobacteriaceae bacterium]
MKKPTIRAIASAGAAALVMGALLSCAAPSSNSGDEPTGGGGGEVTADNPFGLAAGTSIDAVVFDGGYHTDYVDFAGEVLKAKFPDVTVKVTATSEINAEMQPRFVGGNPPDLLDNQGAQQIPLASVIESLATWDDLWEAENYEGVKISDAVYPGIRETGTYNGRFVQVPYVMTAWAFYYSQSLFDENSWTPPKTWDEALTLCESAKAKDLKLFVWGKEAASYWKYLALDSAVKQGGVEIVERIANLEPGAWDDPTLRSVLDKFKQVIDNQCFIPGGSGQQFTQAQAQWSNDKSALLYYTGSWIENEMAQATADNFQMTAWPPLVVDEATAALPFAAIDSGADEKFVLPADSANIAGGKELMRAMLSKEAASNFAKTRLAPTIVKDTVPADGFGSTALASTVKLISESGESTFSWSFGGYDTYYAFGPDELVIWNAFLDGQKTVDELIADEEALGVRAASDANVEKVKYSF